MAVQEVPHPKAKGNEGGKTEKGVSVNIHTSMFPWFPSQASIFIKGATAEG